MSHVGDGRVVGLDVTRWACSEPMRIAFRSLVSLTLLWTVSLLASEPATYTNAVGDKLQSPSSISWSNPLPFQCVEGQTEPRREVRDPCIIQDAGSYYLVFTMWPFANREEKRMDLPKNGSSPASLSIGRGISGSGSSRVGLSNQLRCRKTAHTSTGSGHQKSTRWARSSTSSSRPITG